jgi:hypothetical protein
VRALKLHHGHEVHASHHAAGEYFRNNVWWWRRLRALVEQTCTAILTEQDIHEGSWNNGHHIGAAKAEKLAGRLCELARSERRDELEATIAKELPGDYAFSWENVLEFAEFCRASGGFDICRVMQDAKARGYRGFCFTPARGSPPRSAWPDASPRAGNTHSWIKSAIFSSSTVWLPYSSLRTMPAPNSSLRIC